MKYKTYFGEFIGITRCDIDQCGFDSDNFDDFQIYYLVQRLEIALKSKYGEQVGFILKHCEKDKPNHLDIFTEIIKDYLSFKK